ncbi:MAG: phosphatidylserine decarboxylase, partial [Sulfurimonas sp.]|nr:phosphatidylserine decarboxylase [Sulfurimonas sp.]
MHNILRLNIRLLTILFFFFFSLFANEVDTKVISKVQQTKLLPVMQEFKHSINEDPMIRMYLNQMIQQVSSYYKLHPEPNVYLESVDEMLYLINEALRTAPEYNESDLVGCQINSILNWTMNVPAGFAVFRNERMNEMFRKVLADYTTYLNSEASL